MALAAEGDTFSSGAVRQPDLLTALPRSSVPASGFAAELALRPLPFGIPGIDVGLLWHGRHDKDTPSAGCARRWRARRGEIAGAD